MAHLSGTLIGRKAGTLAAALALGAAVLSLAPGQAAYAARGITNEAGDADTGGGVRPGSSTTAKDDINSWTKCTITRPDGTIDFYIPGDIVHRDGKYVMCGRDGQWVVLDRSTAETGTYSGGGTYTQAP